MKKLFFNANDEEECKKMSVEVKLLIIKKKKIYE